MIEVGLKVIFFALAGALSILWGCTIAPSQPGDEKPREESVRPGFIERSGELQTDEIWSGEVRVKGELIIPRNVSVTVMPGTLVRFEPGTNPPGRMIVRGSLYAQGNPERPIVFNSASLLPKEGDWEGLIFTSEGMGSALRSCLVQYHTYVYINADNVRITDSSFSHARESGIVIDNAAPQISNISVSRSETGLHCLNGARPEITQSSILLNGYGIVCENGSSPQISNSVIANNKMHGVVCYTGSSPKLVSCNIVQNGGWAVYGGGRIVDCFIMGNNKRPPDEVENNPYLSTDQYRQVEEITNLRNSPVPYAGVRREMR